MFLSLTATLWIGLFGADCDCVAVAMNTDFKILGGGMVFVIIPAL